MTTITPNGIALSRHHSIAAAVVVAAAADDALQAIQDPAVIGNTAAGMLVAWLLRFLYPLLMFHVALSFVLAIILEPYSLLRIMTRHNPGVPQVSL